MQALQETLQANASTGQLHVYPENDYSGYSAGTIAGIVIGVLFVVALGSSLGCFLYHRRTGRASDPQGLTEHQPPASTPGQGPSGASTSLGVCPLPVSPPRFPAVQAQGRGTIQTLHVAQTPPPEQPAKGLPHHGPGGTPMSRADPNPDLSLPWSPGAA
ncbi:carcinoembryonic antigen-related cell adhesion molecule 4-like [Phyllostomus discolor]|uniref:Carcinoembryonic antigen-related cell adhesion molecule 4-like n=1 Tax=Phyllostomus discolor TaxID=89673 RepID=A0A7E6CP64_9CHIR|nr:carcinoembryonic antigen-related cell adhesion molecule 4-like [Phyllostomus discolor]